MMLSTSVGQIQWLPCLGFRVSLLIGKLSFAIAKERGSHCPGVDNPEDLVTRRISADELVNLDIGLQGPTFLVEGPWVMDDQMESPGDHSFQSEEAVDAALVPCEPVPPLFPLEQWGTFTKAIRVVSWVQRFIQNSKSTPADRRKGDLSFDELQAAKQCLIRAEQENAFSAELDALRKGRKIPKCFPLVKLSPFVAEDGFLRVQGRLQLSQLSWEENHPIILPKSHLTLLLTRFQHSLMKHAGVSAMISFLRNQFWILGVRRLAKCVKRECVHCKRQDSSPCQQPMSPLPDFLVTLSFPFAVTGLDHAGTLYCCDFARKKFWVLLFTCGVIGAVHLELVESLSTEQTLLALRRLAARWGLQRVIFSDNAKGFIASPQQLQKQFGHVAPDWRFIAPRSPWWGGWWER